MAIFDATNSQKKRRQWIWNTVKARNARHHVVFVESICEAPNILEENMRSKAANSPDYVGMSPQQALADLRIRIANYENAYQTVSNVRVSYIKLYDLSSRVLVNKIYGRLATSLVPYLMSVHIGTRPIWLVRAGASWSAFSSVSVPLSLSVSLSVSLSLCPCLFLPPCTPPSLSSACSQQAGGVQQAC